jgi:hypothetical protein
MKSQADRTQPRRMGAERRRRAGTEMAGRSKGGAARGTAGFEVREKTASSKTGNAAGAASGLGRRSTIPPGPPSMECGANLTQPSGSFAQVRAFLPASKPLRCLHHFV